ncbi:MAG: thiamine biosynthesis protein [Candidatus Saccharibacteria bacterium]|nr:thiamine biosynthesis protein [Candidatus Saccharibacteria bacterium]
MGMPVSIDIPDATSSDVFQKIFGYFRHVDQQFSPYKESSEVSLFAKGAISKQELSADLLSVMEQCDHYEKLTNGYFSAYYAGVFDPSGYVKAWAINSASALLAELGFDTFLINIGGDMVARGDIRSWNLAIQDPFDVQAILGTVQLTNKAIATSGSYVRGNHIFDPHTKKHDSDLISVSIYGDSIVQADVFATACIAMGYDKARAFLRTQPDYAALLVKQNGESEKLNNFSLNY